MANVIIDIAEYNTLCDAQRENQELKRGIFAFLDFFKRGLFAPA